MGRIRTSEETAIILAVMMQRAEITRARISDKTIRLVSGRKRLEGSFRVNLNTDIAEFGFVIVPLDSGGQAIIKVSALEAAKSLTSVKVLKADEIQTIKKGTTPQLMDRFREELNENGDNNEDGTE